VASLGVRPTLERGGQVRLEVHCLQWPAPLDAESGYGRLVRVELLAKLHDERRYESIDALRAAIAADTRAAQDWFARHRP
jgi:riboflavin kinase/FMN adenylyltransferase